MSEGSALLEACNRYGIALTRERLIVVRVLSESNDHPSAVQLLERARVMLPTLSRAAVYRTLRLLQRWELVRKIEPPGGVARYEDATQSSHGYLIDAQTGSITNFTDLELERLIGVLLAQRGRVLAGYRLEVLYKSTPPAYGGHRWSSRRPTYRRIRRARV